MVRKLTAWLVIFLLAFEQSGFAQAVPQLPMPAYLSVVSSADVFRPARLRSVSFDAVSGSVSVYVDKGDAGNADAAQMTGKLVEYLKVGLRLPNDMFWVNLRPDTDENMIDPYLERTDIGRILLAADVQLKKDLARFTSPDTKEGRAYWNKLYSKAEELFGGEDVEIPTVTRPWIVPGEIIIKQTPNGAYIYKAVMKVCLEQDWIVGHRNLVGYQKEQPARLSILNEYSSQLIRELIIPQLTREVNSSKRYSQLRQVYFSLILAQIIKASAGNKELLAIDSKNLSGVTSREAWSKGAFYRAYRSSFENGEYDLQQQVETGHGITIRRYFSGGAAFSLAPAGQKPVVTVIKGDSIDVTGEAVSLTDGLQSKQYEKLFDTALDIAESISDPEFMPLIKKYRALPAGKSLTLTSVELNILGDMLSSYVEEEHRVADAIFSRLDDNQKEQIAEENFAFFKRDGGEYRTMSGEKYADESVVIRFDFNTPSSVKQDDEGNIVSVTITDPARIIEGLQTLLAVLNNQGKEGSPKRVVLVMHYEPKVTNKETGKKEKRNLSTEHIAKKLIELLPEEYKNKVVFMADSVKADGVTDEAMEKILAMNNGEIIVLENIRYADGEKKNDEELRKQLEALGTKRIIDAFGAIHRKHASMMLEGAVMGLLLQNEIDMWSQLLDPNRGSVAAIFGGSKVEDKVDLMKAYLSVLRAGDKIFIGGAMAYPFLLANQPDLQLGNSMIQADKVDLSREIMDTAKGIGVEIVLQVDHRTTTKLGVGAPKYVTDGRSVPEDQMAVDIGPMSEELFEKMIEKLIRSTDGILVWNGPVGAFEDENGGFNDGTFALARLAGKLADEGYSIKVGGGETGFAIRQSGASMENIEISTGGGAVVDYLARKGDLPVMNNLKDGGSLEKGSMFDLPRYSALKVKLMKPLLHGMAILELTPYERLLLSEIVMRGSIQDRKRAEDALKAANRFDAGRKNQAPAKYGGIDFRSLPVIHQPMPALGGLKLAVDAKELNAQLRDIRKALVDGKMPYGQLKAYAAYCARGGASDNELQQVRKYIDSILRAEEDAAIPTSTQMKEILACLG